MGRGALALMVFVLYLIALVRAEDFGTFLLDDLSLMLTFLVICYIRRSLALQIS